ncbi:MAG: hypothetical protein SX243_06820 [Acidobacteriota bacterium]|nr:hypothetical protein [Acidobacteriota bacterium]
MSINLTDFLIELSENPARLREFRRDPHRVATEMGLGDRERNAVVRRDAQEIRNCASSGLEPTEPRPIFVQSTVAELPLPV